MLPIFYSHKFVEFNDHGFHFTEGSVTPDRELENLKKIEQILANNMIYFTQDISIAKLNQDKIISDLMFAARSNREFLKHCISTDNIFGRVWSDIVDDKKQIESIYSRIQNLLPDYQEKLRTIIEYAKKREFTNEFRIENFPPIYHQNFGEMIKAAKALGFEGKDEDAPNFLVKAELNVINLLRSNIIEWDEVIRTPEGKWDVVKTVQGIRRMWSLLTTSIRQDNLKVFIILVELGMDVTTEWNTIGESILAKLYSDKFNYRFLLELYRIRPDLARSPEKFGGTYALTTALSYPFEKESLKLIEVGVNINGTKGEPLFQAIHAGSTMVTEALLAKGVDVTLHSHQGSNLLVTAAITMGVSFIKKLMDAGIDINGRNASGNTALHFLTIADGTNIDCAKELINQGIEVDAKNNAGNTALHLAVSRGQFRLVQFLLDTGLADPTILNNDGETPTNKASLLNTRAMVALITKKRTIKMG